MKHSNIAIFVPHIGCPMRCSFCDQRTISGAQHAPTADEVITVCEQAKREIQHPENTEVAFFGGSFTAISRSYMLELLEVAHGYVGDGGFKGIRISTRPDFIDDEVLGILKSCGVTAIELGAQSMSDRVLAMNERGHTAADVERASALIRAHGFELGLQMMIGLYGSRTADEQETVERIAAIHPDTVRIYPVVILKNTRLGELYFSGEYKTFAFGEVADMTAEALLRFESMGIRVIKCGLHASEFVERDMVGGFYHPALKELCENIIYRKAISRCIAESGVTGAAVIAVHPSCISKAVGQKRSNIAYFAEKGIIIKIIGDENVPKYSAEHRR